MIFETIAAIATPVGTGGVGIIRLSGPQAFRIAGRLFRMPDEPLSEAKVSIGFVRDPESGQKVDEALLLRFPAPRSYTTEDVAEIQCHGGAAILEKVLALCLAEGARLAAPGEFTKRAFLGGRLDLSQAEAIGDLIEARTERALENAIAQLEGTLSQALRSSRDRLLDGLARLEAAIDYPDEIDPPSEGELETIFSEAIAVIEGLLGTARQGRILREGFHLALVGEPNVGKSSLLNRLLGTERAIVTAIPGTTRDLIEENLRLGGWLFRLSDTAGIRESEDPIERLGIERSHRVLEEADGVLLVVDATASPTACERADLV
ncbi:MAG: tRNA uridine-5-carboxymethylaminomethyl(34) synthesis GTPase MnmE, partial [Bacteroidota bacterium]